MLNQNNFEELLRTEDLNNYTEDNFAHLLLLKKAAVLQKNQKTAKYIWCLETIFNIKKQYIQCFNLMKKRQFREAWNLLDRCDIELGFLKRHFDYSNNQFKLNFIQKQIPKFQALYPYDIFFSRETIESDFTCSICGAKIGLRRGCPHEVGEIYDGEMCCRQINKIDFIGLSIVKTPFDKYTVPEVSGVRYNYHMLEHLIKNLDSAFEDWDYEIEEKQWHYKEDVKFKDAERNVNCPCGSGKKFKQCCLKKEGEIIKHYQILFHKVVQPVAFSTFRTKIPDNQ